MTRFTTDVGRAAVALPDALAIIEDDGIISWTNQAAVDLLDLRPVSWLGRALDSLVHPDDRTTESTFDETLGRLAGKSAIARVRDGAGSWRQIEFRSRAMPAGIHGGCFQTVLLREASLNLVD